MDNNGPAAMVLALKGVIEKNSQYVEEAAAILDYIYFYSEAQVYLF
jgi:hypothetical protein